METMDEILATLRQLIDNIRNMDAETIIAAAREMNEKIRKVVKVLRKVSKTVDEPEKSRLQSYAKILTDLGALLLLLL